MVKDLVQETKKLYEKEKYYEAKEKLEKIRFDYPGNAFIAEVQLLIGLCYFGLKDYVVAEQEFRILLRDFPSNNKFADDAMYYLTKSLYKQSLPARLDQNITKQTIEQANDFLISYPLSEYIKEVQTIKDMCYDKLAKKIFLAGRLYRKMGYPSSAIHYFKILEDSYPDSKWNVKGIYEMALSYFEQKDIEEAAKILSKAQKKLDELVKKERDNFVRKKEHSLFYKTVHLFGLIKYETRSDIKIFIDELSKDINDLKKKIIEKDKKKE